MGSLWHWEKITNWCDRNSDVRMSSAQSKDVLDNFGCGKCPNKNEECHDCPIYRAYQNQISDCWRVQHFVGIFVL